MHLEVPLHHAREGRREPCSVLFSVPHSHAVRLDLHGADHSPVTTPVPGRVVAAVEVHVIARMRRRIAWNGGKPLLLEESPEAGWAAQKLGERERGARGQRADAARALVRRVVIEGIIRLAKLLTVQQVAKLEPLNGVAVPVNVEIEAAVVTPAYGTLRVVDEPVELLPRNLGFCIALGPFG
jgi:hypothetical protein